MPILSCIVPLFAKFLLQLVIVTLDLLETGAREHFIILVDLLRHEHEKLTHLEGHIEEFLIDKLGRVCLTVSLLDPLHILLQISELILFRAWTSRRTWLSTSDIVEHGVDLGLNVLINLFLNGIKKLLAQELTILELQL